jgi:hypothetical protein
VFGGVVIANRFGMKEKPSAPHTRLACIHLLASSFRYRPQRKD